MLRRIANGLLIVSICCSPLLVAAATPEEAKTLLKEAVAFYQQNGKEKTFAEINNREGKFTRGELYIFVYDANGIVAAHGADASQIGRNVMNQQDQNEKFFSREIMKVGKSGGSVDYVWMNPTTGTLQRKTSYIMLVDEFRFGCGIYK